MEPSILISLMSAAVAIIALFVGILRNRWMAKQLRLSSIPSIITWLEGVRPDRKVLYQARREGRDFTKWTDAEKRAAYRVTRKLDILGLLESLGYLDTRLVDRFYAIPTAEMWEMTNNWLVSEREIRGPQHLWEFEQLAKRVRCVKCNHPAILGTKKWKRNPRR